MIIYKATNKINGKCYIGQTVKTLARRKCDHLCRLRKGDRDHKFYLALRKYGQENFEWETLQEHFAHGLREFCKNFSKEKLTHSSLSQVATGKWSHYKGYQCEFATATFND